jgi:acyl carrier protein
MDIRQTIHQQMHEVAAQHQKSLPSLTDDMGILESGMDSLGLAVLLAGLDDIFHVAPFDADDVEIPVTIGDLIRVYTTAVDHVPAA